MKTKNLIYGLGVLLGVGVSIAGLAYGRMKLDEHRNIEAQEKFELLKKLADYDQNGSLSYLEKELLLERLNHANNYYCPIKWSEEDLERTWNYGLGYSLGPIEEVIKIYKK